MPLPEGQERAMKPDRRRRTGKDRIVIKIEQDLGLKVPYRP